MKSDEPIGLESTQVLYFAYGSCMGSDFQNTVPEFQRIGRAVLKGYRLAFTHFSRNRMGGVADIVPDKKSHVEGVLYEFDEEFLFDLDVREGVPYNVYRRIEVVVETARGPLEAFTYEVVDKSVHEVAPSIEYAELVLQSAALHVDPSYLTQLRSHIRNLQLASGQP